MMLALLPLSASAAILEVNRGNPEVVPPNTPVSVSAPPTAVLAEEREGAHYYYRITLPENGLFTITITSETSWASWNMLRLSFLDISYDLWRDESNNTIDHYVDGNQSRTIERPLPKGDYMFRIWSQRPRVDTSPQDIRAFHFTWNYMPDGSATTTQPPPVAETASEPRSFTVTPGNGQAELSWSAPSETGGSPVLYYEVSRDGGSTWSRASGNTRHTFTGLTNGTSYRFSVRAVTEAGPGTATTAVTATPNPPSTPSLNNPMSQWAVEEMKRAHELGLIPDSLLNPNIDFRRPITRAEFAGVAVKTLENMTGRPVMPAVNNPFTDTGGLSATSRTDVLKAYNAGIMVGVSGNRFDPQTALNREQCATALTRVFKCASMPGWTYATDANFTLSYTRPPTFADDRDISGWARDSVYFMAANNIIRGVGDNRFAPRNITSVQIASEYATATREQAIAIALRMVDNLR